MILLPGCQYIFLAVNLVRLACDVDFLVLQTKSLDKLLVPTNELQPKLNFICNVWGAL